MRKIKEIGLCQNGGTGNLREYHAILLLTDKSKLVYLIPYTKGSVGDYYKNAISDFNYCNKYDSEDLDNEFTPFEEGQHFIDYKTIEVVTP